MWNVTLSSYVGACILILQIYVVFSWELSNKDHVTILRAQVLTHWSYHIFSVIRCPPLYDAPQTFQHDFSKLTNWKLSQNTQIQGTASIFGHVHLNFNNNPLSDYSLLPMWIKLKKFQTYFYQKQKNHTYQHKKYCFLKCKYLGNLFLFHKQVSCLGCE